MPTAIGDKPSAGTWWPWLAPVLLTPVLVTLYLAYEFFESLGYGG